MATPKKKKENPLINILFNIVIPVIILSKYSTEEYLGAKVGLGIALLFPVSYFIYDYAKEKKANAISIIGFVSVLLTGVIGIFEFPSKWIAYKEASVPLLIALAVLISMHTRFPLVNKLIYNEDIIDVERIDKLVAQNNAQEQLKKVMKNASYMVAASFLLSTILNFILAKILIHSPSGTVEFTEEIGKLTALSYPIIALPSTVVFAVALWYVFKKLGTLTGLTFEELLRIEDEQKAEK